MVALETTGSREKRRENGENCPRLIKPYSINMIKLKKMSLYIVRKNLDKCIQLQFDITEKVCRFSFSVFLNCELHTVSLFVLI